MIQQRFGLSSAHTRAQRVWKVAVHLRRRRVPVLPAVINLAVRAVYSCDLPLSLDLPDGVVFAHNALGVVVHPAARFEGPALVFHHVTIGNSWTANEGVPTIGSGVLIGAGASILGPVRVGDGAVVGAGAVVLRDVPAGYVAVGNPATVRPSRISAVERERLLAGGFTEGYEL